MMAVFPARSAEPEELFVVMPETTDGKVERIRAARASLLGSSSLARPSSATRGRKIDLHRSKVVRHLSAPLAETITPAWSQRASRCKLRLPQRQRSIIPMGDRRYGSRI